MSSQPAPPTTRPAHPFRAVAQLSSALIAVLVVSPLGVPRHGPTGAGASLRTQAANWIMPASTLELGDTPPLMLLPVQGVAPVLRPQRTAFFAATLTQQDVLIASRMGGRIGP